MKKNLINESEINEILLMHKSLKEQTEQKLTTDVTSDLVNLRKAITVGCLKNGKLLSNPNQTKYVYRASTKSGKIVDFTADMNYKFTDGSKSGKWKCDEIAQMAAASAAAETTASEIQKNKLDPNQTKILEILKPQGWSHEPAPTDVEVDQGLFQKLNLSDSSDQSKNPLGFKYGKYFTTKFPKGFYIYKKIVAQSPEETKLGSKVEVTSQSCKAAIESLFNNMTSPMTYPLTGEELTSYKTTANTCAEPANSEKFLLKFGLKDKLVKLKNSRILNP